MEISVTRSANPQAKPDWGNLGFGNYYTDHMFIMDYTEGHGWHHPRVVPYGTLEMDPAAMVFHYGLEIFEGLKAYYAPDGRVLLFRPDANARRLNASARRLCMPEIPVEQFVEAVKAIVREDIDWVPKLPGTSLYIRPFVIADEPHLGVRRANHFKFVIILSPVGAYYPEGLDPVKIYVEDEYVRAVKGGTGFTKCGGNYAASIIAQYKAQDLGYTQVLWLDGNERKYIEEVGTMNVMFKIDGKVITPALNGSILPGITRDSVINVLEKLAIPVEERPITTQEIVQAAAQGKLEEAFGTGTAAVISPIGELFIEGQKIIIGGGKIGPLSQQLYDTLTGIQWGLLPDEFGWNLPV